MGETIVVDDWFYEWVEAEIRDGETMGEALVRLTGAPAPDPESVSGIISREKGEQMKSRIEQSETTDFGESEG